jgi:hypothetical protein
MKNEPEMIAAWEKLTAACRRNHSGAPAKEEGAPFGFAQRIAARAMELRRNERLAWWTRWSLRTAACAGIVAGLMALRQTDRGVPPVLFSAPALEIPGFSAL